MLLHHLRDLLLVPLAINHIHASYGLRVPQCGLSAEHVGGGHDWDAAEPLMVVRKQARSSAVTECEAGGQA